jgi:heme oxygenase
MLATRVRQKTAAVHQQAEDAALMVRWMAGDVTRGEYGALLAQLRHVYAALEAQMRGNRADPVVGGFLDPRIERVAAIDRDLRSLGIAPADPVPATRAYVDRITEVGRTWPTGLIAHHYTRYLGDLSGGRVLAARLGAALGLSEDDGLAFFHFDVGAIPAYRTAYRERLDSLALGESAEQAFIAEVTRAFEHNTRLFEALG